VASQSLYRKYRPQRFSELVGQEHVTNALRNAVRDGRVGHAYLFSGPRGTGKTTTARILAKALNCTNLGDDGEPCGECDNCRAIAEGTFMDLREIDAASNRGVDDARDLRQKVAMGLGANTRHKVYILDEVHMLSTESANTLLKTLEEPPEHVVFVLATTNPESVLPTIRSRTQHYEFTLLSTEQLRAHLADICAREGVDAGAEALTIIARAGAGSARDALSLLDQALAHGTGRLDTADVAALFGGAPFELRARILAAIASEDAATALVTLGELLDSGHEPRRVAGDMLRAARDAFLLTAGGGRVHVDAPAEDQERLRELGESLGNAALVRTLETLGQAVVDMRGIDAADPRLVLEVALVRLSRRDAGPPLQMLVERIERLERSQGAGGGARRTPSAEPEPPGASAGSTAAPAGARPALGALRASSAPEQTPTPEAAPAAPAPAATEPANTELATGEIELDDVIVAWAEILPELPMATRTAVQTAQPLRLEGHVIVFGVPPNLIEAAKPRFHRAADSIREAFSRRLGRTMKFKIAPAEDFTEISATVRGSGGASGPGGRGGGRGGDPSRDEPPLGEPPPDDDPPDSGPPRQPEADEHIDLSETVDAGSVDVGASSVGLLEQQLGATVVEEKPRD
jgi:DNA polymerase-3 subunit gamma/tau